MATVNRLDVYEFGTPSDDAPYWSFGVVTAVFEDAVEVYDTYLDRTVRISKEALANCPTPAPYERWFALTKYKEHVGVEEPDLEHRLGVLSDMLKWQELQEALWGEEGE